MVVRNARTVWLSEGAEVLFRQVDRARTAAGQRRWFSRWVSQRLKDDFAGKDVELAITVQRLRDLNAQDIELHKELRRVAEIIAELKAERGEQDQQRPPST